jgi:hypothetical protein
MTTHNPTEAFWSELRIARRNVQNVHKSTLDIGGMANPRAFRGTFAASRNTLGNRFVTQSSNLF